MLKKIRKKEGRKKHRMKRISKTYALMTLCFVFASSAMGVAAADFSISNIVVELAPANEVATKVYPGYTMSFDVAMVSGYADEGQPVMFEYSVVDADDTLIYSIGEQRKIGKENVFTKRMTLPPDIKPGKYKLRIKSVVDEQTMIQEQFFEIEKSPVVTLKDNGRYFLTTLVTNNGWFLGGAIVFLLTATFFVGILIARRRNQINAH